MYSLKPPAPPPAELLPEPPPPPATTKYETTLFAGLQATADTVKVPGPVKVCILSFPLQVTVPPVADIKPCCKPSPTTDPVKTILQPSVAST